MKNPDVAFSPQNIWDVISSVDFEENGCLHITSADWCAGDLILHISVKTGIDDEHELWQVEVSSVREELIKSAYCESIALLDDHPLLWRYLSMQGCLYFGRPTKNVHELSMRVYDAHVKLTSGWYDLNTFINKNISLVELCSSQSGLFAEGPMEVLQEYKGQLDYFEMNPSIVDVHSPKRWSEGQWVDETNTLVVLIIGDSYVIAEHFIFSRA